MDMEFDVQVTVQCDKQNQLDALISQIYFWNKTLHVLDTSSVHHQELHPDPARKLSSNLYDIHHRCVYSEKFLMVDRGTVRNLYSFIPKINLRN